LQAPFILSQNALLSLLASDTLSDAKESCLDNAVKHWIDVNKPEPSEASKLTELSRITLQKSKVS